MDNESCRVADMLCGNGRDNKRQHEQNKTLTIKRSGSHPVKTFGY